MKVKDLYTKEQYQQRLQLREHILSLCEKSNFDMDACKTLNTAILEKMLMGTMKPIYKNKGERL